MSVIIIIIIIIIIINSGPVPGLLASTGLVG